MPDLAFGFVVGLGFAALLALALARLAGFRSQRVEHYAGTTPRFDVTRHLTGRMLCEGMIHGPLGRVESRFTARMEGRWAGRTGTLREEFTFASGERQLREWRISLTGETSFTATADDVVGTATGRVAGAALVMRYRLRLPTDAGGHVLNVTDWLYLAPGGVILNRSEMRKFGLKVAELTATMRPAKAAAIAEAA